MRLNAQVLRWNDQERILLAIEDITEYKAALEALKTVDRRKDEFLSLLAWLVPRIFLKRPEFF